MVVKNLWNLSGNMWDNEFSRYEWNEKDIKMLLKMARGKELWRIGPRFCDARDMHKNTKMTNKSRNKLLIRNVNLTSVTGWLFLIRNVNLTLSIGPIFSVTDNISQLKKEKVNQNLYYNYQTERSTKLILSSEHLDTLFFCIVIFALVHISHVIKILVNCVINGWPGTTKFEIFLNEDHSIKRIRK